MYILFWICVLVYVLGTILSAVSVEHKKLKNKYGTKRGTEIGKKLGVIAGTIELVFLIAIWIAPQPRFELPLYATLMFSIPLLLAGAWIAIKGVKDIGTKEAWDHLTKKVIDKGIYSKIRHPQHIGWGVSYIGGVILFSGYYALLFTPVLFILGYLLSVKEEKELVNDFGDAYLKYKKRVPMFIPRM